MDEGQRLVKLANDRLRKGKVGISLLLRGKGDWLYLRGTFPPRPGSSKRQPYQQLIALKMRATPAAVKQAEALAKVVGGELNLGSFNWAKWSDADSTEGRKVEDWVREFEAWFWRKHDRENTSQQNTWDKAYHLPLKRLPPSKELTLELLIDWVIENTDPDTRRRQQYCTCGKALAKLAGLPTEIFKELAGGYGLKAVNPRTLPSDEAIVQTWKAIENPGWRYLFGLQATYGLRNHECFGVDYSDFPVIRIRDTAKTGARPVKPLYPEWVELFGLKEPIYPARMRPVEGMSNAKLGSRLTMHFAANLGDWRPYNLRHCYARRCAEFGVPPDVAAQMMGHTLKIHLCVYRSWIGEKVFLSAFDRALNRADRPSAPT